MNAILIIHKNGDIQPCPEARFRGNVEAYQRDGWRELLASEYDQYLEEIPPIVKESKPPKKRKSPKSKKADPELEVTKEPAAESEEQ